MKIGRGEGAMGCRRNSWHTADGSSITVSPPSGGRSEELSPPPPILLHSPSLFFSVPSCYVIKLEEELEERESMVRDFCFIIYQEKGSVKRTIQVFLHILDTL